MATLNQDPFISCFQNWIAQQRSDLEDLRHAITSNPNDERLHLLVEKIIKHFEEYHQNRAVLAQQDAPSFFSPSWCTSFESSFLWIGGCRPSVFVRLVYSLSGSELEAQLWQFFRGERKGNLGEISPCQLNSINSLHRKTENIADEPLAMIANNCSEIGESNQEVNQALDAHACALAHILEDAILEDADKFRLNIIKELIQILTPLQAVDLLVASMKLHLSIHDWGKRRDLRMGKI
ncbi:hypothetical protein RJ639_005438 [Escallonia herrerae]|uniref:DOG1 domain-containing protein n=1 Tax=Escallonia herrerae TaxID=1293975 RepID=A0AA88VXG1_9ASTE|nr:hypothetical protein RJ639_005438 [Escallonia herrerae]